MIKLTDHSRPVSLAFAKRFGPARESGGRFFGRGRAPGLCRGRVATLSFDKARDKVGGRPHRACSVGKEIGRLTRLGREAERGAIEDRPSLRSFLSRLLQIPISRSTDARSVGTHDFRLQAIAVGGYRLLSIPFRESGRRERERWTISFGHLAQRSFSGAGSAPRSLRRTATLLQRPSALRPPALGPPPSALRSPLLQALEKTRGDGGSPPSPRSTGKTPRIV